MPTYDYMCDSCGISFEVQHKMADNPIIVCPQCGQTARQMLSAGFGLNFTGKGFYQTDTRKPAGSANISDAKSGSQRAEGTDKPATCSCGCSGGCACSSE